MLFPKESRPVSEPAPQVQAPAQAPAPIVIQAPSSGLKIPILFGAVLALIGASLYLFYQLNEVRNELAQTKESLSAEISKMYETSTVTTQTSRRSMDKLEKDTQRELSQARATAAQLSGQAKTEAEHHADELASKLQKIQEDQGKQIGAVSTEVSAVKTETNAATAKIESVNTEVGTVKTDLSKNKADTEKLIADMKTARGDLGVQSGLIATNGKELLALKELGERNYTEFKLTVANRKDKGPHKFGDVSILLKSCDPKHNKYTIELTADDKTVEKKDRNINEPVQFMLSRSKQPYELVVNDIKKDFIAGYVSAPKVQQPRN
jgi:chromosome segregation ATPase